VAAQRPFIELLGPNGERRSIDLGPERLTVGRLHDLNDVALEPDLQLLVTRQVHCVIERGEDGGWYVADNGSVNGTFVRRERTGAMEQVEGRVLLTDGDAVCILGALTETGEPRYWTLTLKDPLRTRPISALVARAPCLLYDWPQAKLYRVEAGARQEITNLRPQEHKLVRYMAQRNHANGGVPVLCSYDELISAVWGDEAMHTQDEVTHLVWGLRGKIEADRNNPRLLETERGLGYRLRTCPRVG
jgi:DNA-binding winged helix-turn-helix (wHTH) protein